MTPRQAPRHRVTVLASAIPAIFALVAVGTFGAQRQQQLFIGYHGCIAVEEADQLTSGTSLLALAARQPPRRVAVEEMQRWTEPVRDRPRARTSDCTSVFRADVLANAESRVRVTHLARLSALPEEEYGVFFAMRLSDSIVLAGKPVTLHSAEQRQLLARVKSSLPDGRQLNRTLLRAYRYGAAPGHHVVELYVGLPVLNAPGATPPIRRIAIQRHYFVDGRPVAFETYERASGVEERAETEPPQLTYENWSQSETAETVAFVSRDNGRTWSRLMTDVGFEGINWHVHALRADLPLEFERSLSTPH